MSLLKKLLESMPPYSVSVASGLDTIEPFLLSGEETEIDQRRLGGIRYFEELEKLATPHKRMDKNGSSGGAPESRGE
jgi:hypothetical protein